MEVPGGASCWRSLPALLLLWTTTWAASGVAPVCRVWIGDVPQACYSFTPTYFRFSTHRFEDLLNVTSVVDSQGSQRKINLTFSTTVKDADKFIISRADGYCAPRECYEAIPLRRAPDIEARLEISFIPEAAYNVKRVDKAEHSERMLNRSNEECQMLMASHFTFDIVGVNAQLKLLPPTPSAKPPSFPGVCVTIFSARSNFICDENDCQRNNINKSNFVGEASQSIYFEQPYRQEFLSFPNVTRAFDGADHFLFHCAVVMTGLCCLTGKTTKFKQFSQERLSIEIENSNFPKILALVCVMLAGIIVFLGLILWKVYKHMKRNQDFMLQQSQSSKDLPLFDVNRIKVFLLYLKENNSPHLKRILKELTHIIEEVGPAKVLDPYKGLAFEECGVQRSVQLISEPDTVIVHVTTPVGRSAMKADRIQTVFQKYYVTMASVVADDCTTFHERKILTVTMDGDMSCAPLRQRSYYIPDLLEFLLSAIFGQYAESWSGTLDSKKVLDCKRVMGNCIQQYKKKLGNVSM